MKHAVFDDFFSVLGNKQRVRILQFLDAHGERTVTEISQGLGIEQSAVSHNMKRLLLCHFVEMAPRGKERVYSINKDTVQPLLGIIDRHVRTYCVKGCNHWEEEHAGT